MSALSALFIMNASWSGSSPYYRWDETRTPEGAHRCSSSAQCDGNRTCSEFGWCQGTARTEERPVNDPPKPGWGPPDQVQPQPQPGWGPPPSQPVPPPSQPTRPIPQPGWTPPPRPSHRDWNPPPPPPRPEPIQKDPYYRWDETRNRGGAHRCSTSRECDGERTCSQFGWCQGTARPEIKDRYYRWNELRNPLGPHRCRTSYECDGARMCSDSGYCFGRAR